MARADPSWVGAHPLTRTCHPEAPCRGAGDPSPPPAGAPGCDFIRWDVPRPSATLHVTCAISKLESRKSVSQILSSEGQEFTNSSGWDCRRLADEVTTPSPLPFPHVGLGNTGHAFDLNSSGCWAASSSSEEDFLFWK